MGKLLNQFYVITYSESYKRSNVNISSISETKLHTFHAIRCMKYDYLSCVELQLHKQAKVNFSKKKTIFLIFEQ